MTANGREYVTIASDISLYKARKIATWAVYVRGDFGTIVQAGRFHNYSGETGRLELQALCNAIHIASKQTDLSKVTLIIYSEVSHLFKITRTKTGKLRRKDFARADLLKLYVEPALALAKEYEIRPVKAHTSVKKAMASGEKKYYMNRWVDAASHNLMKDLRRKSK